MVVIRKQNRENSAHKSRPNKVHNRNTTETNEQDTDKEGRKDNCVKSMSQKKKLLKSCASSSWRDQALKSEHGTLHGSAGP